jgi:hypothetical protein
MLSIKEFAEEFQTPGQTAIEPQRFAAALHMQVQELATLAGVHCAVAIEVPANAKLQNFLRGALRVLTQSYQITRDRERTLYWFRNVPIPEFGHRTAEQLVSEGKSAAVIGYLNSVEAGSSG